MASDKKKIPGPPVGYVDLLDHEIIVEQNREKEVYAKDNTTAYNPLRPSSAGKCARRLAYEFMEYKGKAVYQTELKDPHVYRLLRLGYSIEWNVLRLFELVKYLNVDMKQQKVICFELDKLKNQEIQDLIIGSVDACFLNREWKTIMDVKSVKDGFARAYRTKWDETLDKFKNMESLVQLSGNAYYADDPIKFLDELGEDWLFDNICQLNSYACSPFMKAIGIDNGVIYKYNKNDSRHYELRFKPSKKLADYVKGKFNEVNKAVSNGTPEKVAKEFALGSQHCAFCPYSGQCWGEDTKKPYFQTFPKKKWPTDSYKLKAKEEIETLFGAFEKAKKEEQKLKEIEKKIITLLTNEEVEKLKLSNGNIYLVKELKSPKRRFELRRDKL